MRARVSYLFCLLIGCTARQKTTEQRAAPSAVANVAPAKSATPIAASSEPVAAPLPLDSTRTATSGLVAPSHPKALPSAPGPRVYAKTRFVWIYPEPDVTRQWIGFLRSGSSALLRNEKPRFGVGCDAFVAIEPKGYVCADGSRATLDENDPVYRAVRPYAADASSPTPHRYAESLGLERYFSTPTPELQRMREGDLRAHLRDVEEARAGQPKAVLDGVDLTMPQTSLELPKLPIPIFEDRKQLKRRSTVAYTAEARFGERAFLLSSDFAWVPKDRVRPYPPIAFHGVEIKPGAPPFAFVRKQAAPKFSQLSEGQYSEQKASFAHLALVILSGVVNRSGRESYYETLEPNTWLRATDIVIPNPQKLTPWGEALTPLAESEETRAAAARAPKGRKTWVEVSIEGGWLIAYEGTQRVFATLISPGKGGVAKPGEDPLERAATPTGTYPISGKFVSSSMEAPNDLIHSDVPYAQNLVGPYALHGAYWHDNWGNPQSGGCINLSPVDAKWLFDWTDPKLPDGWHGVRWLPSEGPATTVVLHR